VNGEDDLTRRRGKGRKKENRKDEREMVQKYIRSSFLVKRDHVDVQQSDEEEGPVLAVARRTQECELYGMSSLLRLHTLTVEIRSIPDAKKQVDMFVYEPETVPAKNGRNGQNWTE
jgi:hypothetical protein